MQPTFREVCMHAAGLGLLTGLRSMSGPALLSTAAGQHPADLAGTPFRLLASPRVGRVLRWCAVGEMGVDKLPFVPSRITPGPLGGRIALGAVTGAAVFAAGQRPALLGAAIGGAAAVLGAHLGYRFRTDAQARLHIPAPISGLFEDAFVVSAGRRIAGV